MTEVEDVNEVRSYHLHAIPLQFALTPLRQGTDTHKMKATHNKGKEVEWKFPCLGKSDEIIVLFTGHKVGIAVSSNPVHSIGEYSSDWLMDLFQPLPSTESVTLQND